VRTLQRMIGVSEETAREHAYLIRRGARALALLGGCRPADGDDVYLCLCSIAEAGVIPFVVNCGDYASAGYASQPWALALYVWATNQKNSVPSVHRNEIIGMLLGYDARAIQEFTAYDAGRFLPTPSQTAKKCGCCTGNSAEISHARPRMLRGSCKLRTRKNRVSSHVSR